MINAIQLAAHPLAQPLAPPFLRFIKRESRGSRASFPAILAPRKPRATGLLPCDSSSARAAILAPGKPRFTRHENRESRDTKIASHAPHESRVTGLLSGDSWTAKTAILAPRKSRATNQLTVDSRQSTALGFSKKPAARHARGDRLAYGELCKTRCFLQEEIAKRLLAASR